MLMGRSLQRFSNVLKSMTQRRGISEFAKQMGYKPKFSDVPVARIQHWKNIGCFVGAGILFYDIITDRKEHYEMLMENYDKSKKYFKQRLTLSITDKPDMDFLLDQVFPPNVGEEDHPVIVTTD